MFYNLLIIYFSSFGSITDTFNWKIIQNSAETDRNKVNGRWRYWLDQWVDTQITRSRELEDLDSVLTSNPRQTDDCGRRQLKLRNVKGQNNFEGLDSPIFVPKRSIHHRRRCSLGDHNTLSSSPVPTYMAATESAKAKARSMSSPKTRLGNFDTCSESYLLWAFKISLLLNNWTSNIALNSHPSQRRAYLSRFCDFIFTSVHCWNNTARKAAESGPR